jgi:uncharacterized protein
MIGARTNPKHVAFALLLAALVFIPTLALAAPKPQPAAGRLETITIVTQAGPQAFKVEIASTPKQQERGLMFRTHLPERQGMLFVFRPTREMQMWMKNTLIPLDMLFIAADGHVRRIERNAEPGSLRLIPSEGPVRYVLELNGGDASRYGINPGDRLVIGEPAPNN